jgi:hypothetical protein
VRSLQRRRLFEEPLKCTVVRLAGEMCFAQVLVGKGGLEGENRLREEGNNDESA